GIGDLAVGNFDSATVDVFLSTSGHASYVAYWNWGLTLGDVNKDGWLDIVSTNFGQGKVSVLLNRGDGTFNPALVFNAGSGTVWVVVADFTRDRNLDIDTGQVTLLGNGDGTFQPALPHPSVYGVAAGDLNHDRYPDLVGTGAGTDQGAVKVLLNDTFWTGPSLPAGLALSAGREHPLPPAPEPPAGTPPVPALHEADGTKGTRVSVAEFAVGTQPVRRAPTPTSFGDGAWVWQAFDDPLKASTV